ARVAAVAEKHPDLGAAARSGADLALRLARWSLPARDSATHADEGWGRDDQAPAPQDDDGPALPAALLQAAESLRHYAGPAVRWVEIGRAHVRLHSAPLSVAQVFSRLRKPGQA